MVIAWDGRRVVRSASTAAFLELAGAASDFPYPSELPQVEPGPDVDE